MHLPKFFLLACLGFLARLGFLEGYLRLSGAAAASWSCGRQSADAAAAAGAVEWVRLAAATFVVDAAGFVATVAVVEVGPELMRLFAVDRHDAAVVDTVAAVVAALAAAVVVAASSAVLVVAVAVAASMCAAQLYWAAAPDPTYNRFAVYAEWRVVVVHIVAAAVAQDAAVAAAVALPDAVAAPVGSEPADVDDA